MRFLFCFAVFAIELLTGACATAAQVIDARRYHLGVAGMPEWQEFEKSTPHGPQLDLTFRASANVRENTLFIRQRNVKTTWNVMLNGRKLGALETLTQPLVLALAIPPGALIDGENRLSILRPPTRLLDDIVVGEIALDPRPRDEALAEANLEVTVTDTDSSAPMPCRLTLVDGEAALAPLHPAPAQQ